jgi:hypothetical protein
VVCLGSGELLPQHRGSGESFPLESALFRLSGDGNLAAQVTVSFFENARAYTEGFNVYGDRGALEWPSVEGEAPVTYVAGARDGEHRGRPIERLVEHVPDRTELLPEELRPFTRPGSFDPGRGLNPVEVFAWHGGSHPHLVHEFVSSVVDGRKSAIDEVAAARITGPGIVAHQSALRGGEQLDIPSFE